MTRKNKRLGAQWALSELANVIRHECGHSADRGVLKPVEKEAHEVLEDLIEAAHDVLSEDKTQGTHWDGCLKVHPRCRLRRALYGGAWE